MSQNSVLWASSNGTSKDGKGRSCELQRMPQLPAIGQAMALQPCPQPRYTIDVPRGLQAVFKAGSCPDRTSCGYMARGQVWPVHDVAQCGGGIFLRDEHRTRALAEVSPGKECRTTRGVTNELRPGASLSFPGPSFRNEILPLSHPPTSSTKDGPEVIGGRIRLTVGG